MKCVRCLLVFHQWFKLSCGIPIPFFSSLPLFLNALQNSSLTTLHPLCLVSSAANGCCFAILAFILNYVVEVPSLSCGCFSCVFRVKLSRLFPFLMLNLTKEVSRKGFKKGSNEKQGRTQGCFSQNWDRSLSDLVRCISAKKHRICCMPLSFYLSLHSLPLKWWLCAKAVCFQEMLERWFLMQFSKSLLQKQLPQKLDRSQLSLPCSATWVTWDPFIKYTPI